MAGFSSFYYCIAAPLKIKELFHPFTSECKLVQCLSFVMLSFTFLHLCWHHTLPFICRHRHDDSSNPTWLLGIFQLYAPAEKAPPWPWRKSFVVSHLNYESSTWSGTLTPCSYSQWSVTKQFPDISTYLYNDGHQFAWQVFCRPQSHIVPMEHVELQPLSDEVQFVSTGIRLGLGHLSYWREGKRLSCMYVDFPASKKAKCFHTVLAEMGFTSLWCFSCKFVLKIEDMIVFDIE